MTCGRHSNGVRARRTLPLFKTRRCEQLKKNSNVLHDDGVDKVSLFPPSPLDLYSSLPPHLPYLSRFVQCSFPLFSPLLAPCRSLCSSLYPPPAYIRLVFPTKKKYIIHATRRSFATGGACRIRNERLFLLSGQQHEAAKTRTATKRSVSETNRGATAVAEHRARIFYM